MKKLALAVLAVGLLALGGQAATSGASVRSGGTVYVVRPGDTLSGVASRFGTTPGAIARANSIKNLNVIVIGRKLTIPSGSSSTVAATPTGRLPAKLLAHPDRVVLRPTFEKWAAHYGVPSDVLEAMCWVESGWQSGVVSPTGAVGIGQLQPATVDHVRLLIGIKTLDPRNADDNIRMSARFLKFLLDRTGGDVDTALAAYYQGLRSVTTGTVFTETRQYIAVVEAYVPFFA
jgi:murein DD-endopeptidase MepM/ murein hydrolase activator NlpD